MNNVFEKLKKQRSKECKGTDLYELKDPNEELYKIVDEEEYLKNKKSLKNFIVGGEDLDSSDDVDLEAHSYADLKRNPIGKREREDTTISTNNNNNNKIVGGKSNHIMNSFIREKRLQHICAGAKLTQEDIRKTIDLEKEMEQNSFTSDSNSNSNSNSVHVSESENEKCWKKRKTADSVDSLSSNRNTHFIKNELKHKAVLKGSYNDHQEKKPKFDNKEIRKLGNNIYGFADRDKKETGPKNISDIFSRAKEIDYQYDLQKLRKEREEEKAAAALKEGNKLATSFPSDIAKNGVVGNELKSGVRQFSPDKQRQEDIKAELGDWIMGEFDKDGAFNNINNAKQNEKEEEQGVQEDFNVNPNLLKTKFEELVVSDEGFVYVYIFDVCKHRNSLILFGKTITKSKKCRSISIYIENLDRYYYFLLNKKKVYKENGETIDFQNEKFKLCIMKEFVEEFRKIKEYHNIKIAKNKIVKRKNLNLPTNEEELYMKVLYSYNHDPINEKFQKGNTYTCFYCCNEDIIENFIIKKKIKMPCWVKIKELKMNPACNLTYCYFDCMTSVKKNIFVFDKSVEKKEAERKEAERKEAEKGSGTSNTGKKIEPLPNFADMDLNKMYIKVMSLLNEDNNHEVFTLIVFVEIEKVKYIKFFGIVNKMGIPLSNINYNKNYCTVFDSEKKLLTSFLQKIKPLDIDAYIGYNILNFDLEFLIHRCNVHDLNVDFISRKKKLRKNEKMKVNKFNGSNSTGSIYNIVQNVKGKLIIDVYMLCKELIKLTNYCMDEIIDTMRKKYQDKTPTTNSTPQSGSQQQQAGTQGNASTANKKPNINVYKDFVVNDINLLNSSNIHLSDVNTLLEKHIDVLINSQLFCINEIDKICNILQIIEKTRDLTKLSGYLWTRSLLGYNSERIEFFLLHEYNKKKYITPILKKKKKIDEQKNKNVAKYTGGLVLEPSCGYYDTFVLYLDFNSLYPSIIIEYNVCFSTMKWRKVASRSGEINEDEKSTVLENGEIQMEKEEERVGVVERSYEVDPEGPEAQDLEIDFDRSRPGILPSILKNLVERRAMIKKLIASEKNKEKKELLLIQSLSIKLISNSIYGCLGNTNNRFYARPMASYITQKGRNLLQHTKYKVEKEFNLKVVYGDTDSIMIDTCIKSVGGKNYKEANILAHTIKNSINKNYKRLELDLECIFSKLLLLKKKKYACAKALDPDLEKCEYEMKGIDFIKRDYSKLSKLVGNEILKIMFASPKKGTADTSTTKLGIESHDIAEKIHEFLRGINQKIETDQFDLEYYIITKKLTKNVDEYQEKSSLGHVLVAERLRKDGYNVSVNKEIQFCVCKSSDVCKYLNKPEEKLNTSQCCYTVDEMKKYNLHIDKEYYIKNQILLPINRLCQYIEGTSVEKLSACFNIYDVRDIKTEAQTEENDLETNVLSLLNETADRFQDVHLKGFLNCTHCSNNIKPEIFIKYFRCNRCLNYVSIEKIRNYIFAYIHNLCSAFYKQLYVCNSCSQKTRRILLKDARNCPNTSCENKKNSLKPLVSQQYVYLILELFLHLLKGDLKKIPEELLINEESTDVNKNPKEKSADTADTAANGETVVEKEDTKNTEVEKEKQVIVREEYRKGTKVEEDPGLKHRKYINIVVNEDMVEDTTVCIRVDDDFRTTVYNAKQEAEINRNKMVNKKIETFDSICDTKELSIKITKGLQMRFPNLSNFIYHLSLRKNIFYVNYNKERDILRNALKEILKRNIYSQLYFDKIFSAFRYSLCTHIKRL